jgi:hypothetical protein
MSDSWHPLLQEAIQETHPATWKVIIESVEETQDYPCLVKFLTDWLVRKGIGRHAAYGTAVLVIRETFQTC